MRLSSDAQTAFVTGNVVFLTAAGSNLELSAGPRTLRHGGNWFKPGYVSSFGTGTGAVVDTGGTVTGSDPGFVNLAGQDFHLAASSPLRGKAVAPPAETSAHPLSLQYVKHQSSEPRPSGSAQDIGALGFGSGGGGGGTDGGTGLPDGGQGTPDAGPGPGGPDGGTGAPDGGLEPPQAPEDSGGCGCGTAGSAPFALLLLGALVARSRPRRGA